MLGLCSGSGYLRHGVHKMIEHYLRPVFQRCLFDSLAQLLLRISPNAITLFSVIPGVLAALAIAFGHIYWAVGCLLLSGLCDVLDGTVARLTNNSSPLGAVLDIFCDRVVELAVVFGLFAYEPHTRAWAVLLMLGTIFLCVTSFLVVGVFTQNHSGKGFHYSEGLINRPEAFGFFVVMMLFPQQFFAIALIFAGLVLLTALCRLYAFFKQISEQ